MTLTIEYLYLRACYNCKKSGHITSQCPESQNETNPLQTTNVAETQANLHLLVSTATQVSEENIDTNTSLTPMEQASFTQIEQVTLNIT